MFYISKYDSPIGGITLASNETELTGVWFDKQKFYADNLPKDCEEKELPVLTQTKKWLDIYFSGKNPDFTPPMPDKNNTNLVKTPPFPRFSANSRLKYVQYIYASLYQKSSEISMFWSERV